MSIGGERLQLDSRIELLRPTRPILLVAGLFALLGLLFFCSRIKSLIEAS